MRTTIPAARRPPRGTGLRPTGRRALRRVGRWALYLAGALLLPVLGYATLVLVTWARYGHTGPNGPPEPLLDRFIPAYEVAELHETRVAAPAAITLAAAKELDLQGSPANRAIIAVRSLPARLRGEPARRMRSDGLLRETLGMGWGRLVEEPGRIVVVGAVTQPWAATVAFHALPPARFAAFHRPGYAKIVWTLEAVPLGPDASLARTRTRVVTTDARSRRLFRRYWSLVAPGVIVIRWEALRMLRADAERRARAAAAALPR